MNHSLLSADRATHLKILTVALLAAILFVGIGIAAHLSDRTGLDPRGGTGYVVVKAGKPVGYSRVESLPIR